MKTVSIVLLIALALGAVYYFTAARTASDNSNTSENTSNVVQDETANGPAMTGTWRSNEDAKFTREFGAEGTVTDRYEGDASATETAPYAVIDPGTVEVPGVPAVSLSGMTVIRIDFASGPMFFSINTLTDTELAMTNLSGRGNILSFTKVN